MPPVLNPLTFEEHRDLGRELLKSRARLTHLASVATSVYGAHSRPAFHFQKLNEAMDKLCAEMAAQARVDCPGLDAAEFYRSEQT